MNPYLIAIIDLSIFFFIPLFFLKNWRRSLLVWFGFMITQITMPNCLQKSMVSLGGYAFLISSCSDAWIELAMECLGLILIFIACFYNRDKTKSKHLNSNKHFYSKDGGKHGKKKSTKKNIKQKTTKI